MTTDNTDIQTFGLVLSIVFYVFTFLLFPLLISLAFNKKKFLLYTDQIKTFGQIKNKLGLSIIFDIKLPKYVFTGINFSLLKMDESFSVQTMTRMREKIKALTLISQQISIALVITVLTVIILRTFFK